MKWLNWQTLVDSAGISHDAVTCRPCELTNQWNKRTLNYIFIMISSKNTFLNRITSCSFHPICIKKRQTEQSEAVGVLMRGWTYGLLTHWKVINADVAVSTQKYMHKRAGWLLCWDWHQYKWGLLKKNSNPAFSSEGREELSDVRKLCQDRDVMTQFLNMASCARESD